MDSKLLAGGMQNRFKDNTLVELIEVDGQLDEEDEILQKILDSGKDEKADELIDVLQAALQR